MKRFVPAMIIVMAMLMALLPLSVFAEEIVSEDDPNTTDAIETETETEIETEIEAEVEGETEPDTDAEEETENDEAEGEEKTPEASISASLASFDIFDINLETLSETDPLDFECGCESDCNNPIMIDSACYASLSSAINAVQNGQVIILRGDVVGSGDVSVSTGTFTIVTNGHQLVINASGNSQNSGELRIRNGANVSINGDISSRINIDSGGKLNITGSVTTRSSPGRFHAIEVNGAGSEVTIGGSLTMTSSSSGRKIAINAVRGARVFINGDIIVTAGQSESIGIIADNAAVTVGGDIRGVSGGVEADYNTGWAVLPTEVTINGAIIATRYDVLWLIPQAPAAVGIDEGDGYLTYRAVRNGTNLIVRVAQAYKCINLCDDCSECLNCSECICQELIPPPPGTNTGTETGEESGTGTGEGAGTGTGEETGEGAGTGTGAGTAITTATTLDDDDETTILDNETSLVAALVDDTDDEDDAAAAVNATADTEIDTGAEDAIVLIDDDIPLAPGIIDGSPRSMFTMMFATVGIFAALALSTVLTIKTKKLERSYKGFDEKEH